ncbi:MAG: ComEA family DNA-binding protein [Actinomycetia bacterium]|nr:ComEA family DNA-binding protein [Actinomycetes bacterium]
MAAEELNEPQAEDTAAGDDPAHSPLDELLRRGAGSSATPLAGSLLGRVSEMLPGSMNARAVVAVLVAGVLVGWGGWHWLARPALIEDRIPLAEGAAPLDAGSGSDGPVNPGPGSAAKEDPVPTEPTEQIVVHVAGAVALPGLTELPVGARVGDAMDAAGGSLPGADPGRLNLAARLNDGARLYVPAAGEEVGAPLVEGGLGVTPGDSSQSLVDVNSADAAALEELPGIGPATAAAIISHRERQGPFGSVDSLLEVRGIGEAKLEALEGLVSVR